LTDTHTYIYTLLNHEIKKLRLYDVETIERERLESNL
jgi:hypothetical protein